MKLDNECLGLYDLWAEYYQCLVTLVRPSKLRRRQMAVISCKLAARLTLLGSLKFEVNFMQPNFFALEYEYLAFAFAAHCCLLS